MLTFKPIDKAAGVLQLPGSKYIANRALTIASLAAGETILTNVPDSEDISVMIKGLSLFGAQFFREQERVRVIGTAGSPAFSAESVYTADSGTFSRFLASYASLCTKPVTIDGSRRMRERPMGPIFSTLQELGVGISCQNSSLPAVLTGPLSPGEASIDGSMSSQYLSGLLIAAPVIKPRGGRQSLTLSLKGKAVSQKYIGLTLDMVRKFGAAVEERGKTIAVPCGQTYKPIELKIETDPVSATYFFAAAALTGGEITIRNFNRFALQGEAAFPLILEKAGCRLRWQGESVCLAGPQRGAVDLKPFDLDMNLMPDALQTIAVLAAYIPGESRFTGIAHLRYKESDRIGDTAAELKKLGVAVKEGESSLTLMGGTQKQGALIDCHGDHRMAMSFALAALRTPGIRLYGEECVAKSFPDYFSYYQKIGGICRQTDS